MNNKSLYVMLLMLNIFGMAYPQNVKYSYDASGNRIFREIVIQSTAAPRKFTADVQSVKFSGRNIRISHNQSDGILRIDISDYEVTDRFVCSIFNYSGQKIVSVLPNVSHAELDMSSLSNGVYILRVSLNDESISWKIIKK